MEFKLFSLAFALFFLMAATKAQLPGFVSIDCGGKSNFTDELGLVWTPDDQLTYGQTTNISAANETRQQYQNLRYFPADSRKYCYTLDVTSRGRYLIRATFLYGNFDNNNVYPKFDISLGATHWATIDIWDANTVEVNELIFLALDSSVSVCLSNATTGTPFISTLELRQLNGSVYATKFESQYHLSVSARINFGAENEFPVRYPDDPFDRIWQSDSIKKANYLVDVAAGPVISSVASLYPSALWAQEAGDPCLPVPLAWVECNSDNKPRIIKIKLSGMNLTGGIPSGLTKLNGLVELWLDGNILTGPIPDFSGCTDLKIIHLENNQLTGEVPSFLADLPNLKELYVQNNDLFGDVPSKLLDKGLILDYTGNINLRQGENKQDRSKIIIGCSVGAAALIIATIISCILLNKEKKKNPKKDRYENSISAHEFISSLSDVAKEAAHCFTLSELEDATKEFERKIGSGGFGVVYYGKLKDGREIAVKLLTSNSYQGKREFSNEVTLLSRIHHRNLVQFLGYCQDEGKSILVYEFMHNGTLKEHLYGPQTRDQTISWIKRLEIAEDAAKGIEYLHMGCVPSIIHRDLKTSNILIDKNMRAKVSDFGLSKLSQEGASHVSSIVRGTVGYLDPEYYISQQLTDKSDVYSFGVILLELISGHEAISNESFGVNCRNIVQWAKLHVENGDIQGIIDPFLGDKYDIQSMWKIAEKALMCVQPHGYMRPSMSEVIKEIQECISIERGAEAVRGGNSDEMSRQSLHSSMNLGPLGLGSIDHLSDDESAVQPTAR